MYYKVTKEDLVGAIKDFPIEIVQKLVDQQVKQGNTADVTVFQISDSCNYNFGGFDWGKTKEGYDFWSDVIGNKDFNLFFDRYPKSIISDKKLILRTLLSRKI